MIGCHTKAIGGIGFNHKQDNWANLVQLDDTDRKLEVKWKTSNDIKVALAKSKREAERLFGRFVSA